MKMVRVSKYDKRLKNRGYKKSFPSIKFLSKFKRIIVLVLLLVFCWFLWQVIAVFLSVNALNVVFQDYACQDYDSVKNSLRFRGQFIWLVSEDRVRKIARDNHPCIKDIKIQKYFPNKLDILVIGRKPVAVIAKGVGLNGLIDLAQVEATAASNAATLDFSLPQIEGKKFLFDENGVIFFEVEGEVNVPLVFVGDDLEIRQDLGTLVSNGLYMSLEMFKKLGISFKMLKINPSSNLLVLTEDDSKIVLALKNDILKQLASLQLIWQKNKIESKRIESIDLRFSKPVVIYSK